MMRLVIMILLLPIVSSDDLIKRYDCSDCLGKVYQVETDYGKFCGYQTVQLGKDQTVRVIDNLQGAPDQAKKYIALPFTESLGLWSCCGKNEIIIKTINYNLQVAGCRDPGSVSLNVLELKLIGNKMKGQSGFANFALGTNPTDPRARPLHKQKYGPFRATAEEINLDKH